MQTPDTVGELIELAKGISDPTVHGFRCVPCAFMGGSIDEIAMHVVLRHEVDVVWDTADGATEPFMDWLTMVREQTSLDAETSSLEFPTPEEARLTVGQQNPEPAVPMLHTLGPEHLGMKVFASTDPTRPFLNHLYMRDGFVYATDGGVAAKVPTKQVIAADVPIIRGMGEPTETATITIAGMDKALRIVNPKATMPILGRVFVTTSPEGSSLLSATDLETSGTVHMRTNENDVFPKIDNVIPEKNGRFMVALSYKKLSALCQYAAKHGHGEAMAFWFDPESNLVPVRIEVPLKNHDNRRAVIVLAPIRMYGDWRDDEPTPDKDEIDREEAIEAAEPVVDAPSWTPDQGPFEDEEDVVEDRIGDPDVSEPAGDPV